MAYTIIIFGKSHEYSGPTRERDRLAKQRARADLQRQHQTTSSESLTQKELTA
jgi:hypothetical protein